MMKITKAGRNEYIYKTYMCFSPFFKNHLHFKQLVHFKQIKRIQQICNEKVVVKRSFPTPSSELRTFEKMFGLPSLQVWAKRMEAINLYAS